MFSDEDLALSGLHQGLSGCLHADLTFPCIYSGSLIFVKL